MGIKMGIANTDPKCRIVAEEVAYWLDDALDAIEAGKTKVGNKSKTSGDQGFVQKSDFLEGRAGMPVTPHSSSVSRSETDWSAKFLDLESPKHHFNTYTLGQTAQGTGNDPRCGITVE